MMQFSNPAVWESTRVARRAKDAGVLFEVLPETIAEATRIAFLSRFLDPEMLQGAIHERFPANRISVPQFEGWHAIRPFLTGHELFVHFGRDTPDVPGADPNVFKFQDGAGYLDGVWDQKYAMITPTYAHDEKLDFLVYFDGEGRMGMMGTAMDWWEAKQSDAAKS